MAFWACVVMEIELIMVPFNGNGDRQPNIVCENPGGVHHPGLRLNPGSLRGVGCQRHRDWLGMWGFPS